MAGLTSWGRTPAAEPVELDDRERAILMAHQVANPTLDPDEHVRLMRRWPDGSLTYNGHLITPGRLVSDLPDAEPPAPADGDHVSAGPVDPVVDGQVAGNQGRRAWLAPIAAALLPAGLRPGSDGLVDVPDVRGIVTDSRQPDVSDPHIPGVTFWLYRMWGRDATTGLLYLLYVGETGQRPVERLTEHLTGKDAPARFWRHLIFAWEVDPRVFDSKPQAETAEDRAVKNEWPTQNSQLQPEENVRRWTVRDPRGPVQMGRRWTVGQSAAAVFGGALIVGLWWLAHAVLGPPPPGWVWWQTLLLWAAVYGLPALLVLGGGAAIARSAKTQGQARRRREQVPQERRRDHRGKRRSS